MAKQKLRFEQVPLQQIKKAGAKTAGSRWRNQEPNLIIERPENKREPYTRPAEKRER